MALKRKIGGEWAVAASSPAPQEASVPSSPGTPTPTATHAVNVPVVDVPVTKRRRRNPQSLSTVPAATPMNVPSTSASAAPSTSRPRRTKTVPQQSYAEFTSSSSAPAGTSYATQPPAPPAKKTRKKKDPAAPVPEKRPAQFKPKCPQNIMDRLERVRSQRFYMVARRRNDGELKEEFSVLGSTGNVYTVTIDRLPRCDCPDSSKGNHCKHIVFIMIKVLQVSRDSGLWYQKGLLTTELEQIFREAPQAPNAVSNPRLQEAFARATGDAPAGSQASSSSKKRVPCEGDDCPICYDTMYQVAENTLVYCEECGNAIHQGCFQQWKLTSVNGGKKLTCVWCRSPWATAGAGAGAGAGAVGTGRGYLNLATAVGISPVRDTSSYYHGPRRGQRYYGHQNYDDDH